MNFCGFGILSTNQVLGNRCSQRACPAFGLGGDRCGLSPRSPSWLPTKPNLSPLRHRHPPGPLKDTGKCPLQFAWGVLIGTVHRLGRASLSPSGPSAFPRSCPRSPTVSPPEYL